MSSVLAVALAWSAQVGSIEVRDASTYPLVDARAFAVDAADVARTLAAGAGFVLAGEDLLAGRPAVDLVVEGRPLEQVLDALALATRTQVRVEARAITFLPPRDPTALDDLLLDAETAWIGLIRQFPATEAARVARVELGRAQELRGHEDAALAHYEVAASGTAESPASLDALRAASDLLMRRGEWADALPRLSRLAQSTTDPAEQVGARLGVARCLAEQGRGIEALALVDAVDLSFPPRSPREVAERELARARGHLAAGDPESALRELDARATLDPRRGGSAEDLALRALALQALDAPNEAARAWLACSTVTKGPDRDDALVAAARLAALAGDDLSVLFVERLARGGTRGTEIARLAQAARVRLGLAEADRDMERLRARWAERAHVPYAERATLAVALVRATAREVGTDAAAEVARAAIPELSGSEARTVRTALAAAYEEEGAWAEAARVWGGTAP
jgi:tetratricopeptide (TPR) repeat protein